MAVMLRLLKPVASAWKDLAHILLKKELHHKVNTIESDSVYKDASHKALNDVFSKWLGRTRRAKRIWKTICDTARHHGDESVQQYMEANNFKSKLQYVTRLIKKAMLISQ